MKKSNQKKKKAEDASGETELVFRTMNSAAVLWGKQILRQHCAARIDESTELWFPASLPTKNWKNDVDDDYSSIREKPRAKTRAGKEKLLRQNFDGSVDKRITFLRTDGYRFVGVYRLDRKDEDSLSRLWVRVGEEVEIPKLKAAKPARRL